MSITKVTGMMQTSTKGGDITSASPCVIDTDGDYFDIAGTVSFAAFTVVAGRRFTVQFDGILTMTHHATTLDLPGAANVTTAAGDVAEFFATGTNTVQCVNYTRASGAAVSADIADDSIDSDHYVDGSIDLAHLSADCVDGTKLADNAVDSEHYTDGSIDNAHIADDAIDSEHYAVGSIDEAHIADNAVSLAKMAGNTDGVIITFDASGDPVAVGPGSDGEVLTSTGAGSPPAFEAAGGGGGEISIVFSTLDISLANSTGFSITGAGFRPTACIMSAGITQQRWWNISFINASTQYQYSYDDGNNDEDFVFNSLSGLFRPSADDQQSFSFTSFDADGITLNNAKYGSPTGTASISWVFFK